jgi:hypothetical protein
LTLEGMCHTMAHGVEIHVFTTNKYIHNGKIGSPKAGVGETSLITVVTRLKTEHTN